MSFERDIARVLVKLERLKDGLLPAVAATMHESIQSGSLLTGSPGQPVDTGNLRASWQVAFLSPELAEITTNVEYAPAIEAGVGPHGPLTLRSPVGGFHSVALTAAGAQKVVDYEAGKLVA